MIHELVEVCELRRVCIPIGWETAVRFPSEVYEAHLKAVEVKLTIAEGRGGQDWIDKKLRDAESWLQGPQLPHHLRRLCERLIERFRQKKVGVHSDRLAAAGSSSRD
jgi:hypothetical protein